jgi:heterodisulfide reductase subunit A
METDNKPNGKGKPAAAMVVGGGIGGMRAALDLADAGLKFTSSNTLLPGRTWRNWASCFPNMTVCFAGVLQTTAMDARPSISPAYITNNQHPNIEILTNTHVTGVEGQAGDFTIALRQEPRYVDPARCINCDYCARVCPVELPNEYQLGMTRRKAAYKTAARAAPDAYVIDRGPYCDSCQKCVGVCPTHAINLDEKPRLLSIGVGAVILALGFKVFDPSHLEEFGYGRYKNVIDAMHYERLASRSGPTEGMITRPSDGKKPHSIAWLQCIGSRDQENSFCSSICCMYGTKEAMLAKQRLGEDTKCSIFIMDERAFNKEYSAYFDRARQEHGVEYQRCRVSSIQEDPATHDLLVQYADPNGKLHQERFEMVVLAVGLQPPDSARHFIQLLDLELNEYGFCRTEKFTPLETTHSGVYVCGAFSTPKEISETIIDASGAAAEVMRLLNDRLNTYPYSRAYPFLSSRDLPPEKDVTSEAVRMGIFACTCGSTLGETINVPALMQQAARWPGVVTAKTLDLACLPDTLQHIQNTIQEQGLNRVVVAACSNRTHESLFQRAARMAGLNPYLVELVNLRDQCSRVHELQPELANRKALELIRVAFGRVMAAQAVHKEEHHCFPTALIIGGGLSGMTAALAIADSGYEVVLVERSEVLGGHLQNLYYVAENYNPRRLGRDLINRVRAHRRIAVYLRTEVIEHNGHVGEFRATLRTTHAGGTSETFRIDHGLTIVATGAYETRNHPLLNQPQIITQSDLEEKIIHNPQEITAAKNIVMIQCVRVEDQPAYCSRVCCTNALRTPSASNCSTRAAR